SERRHVSRDAQPTLRPDEQPAAAIEDRSPRRRQQNRPEALRQRDVRVVASLDHLKRPQPQSEDPKQRERDRNEDANADVEAGAPDAAAPADRDRLDAPPPTPTPPAWAAEARLRPS